MNMRNAESAWMAARARFLNWQEKFNQQWDEPILKDQVGKAWNRLPNDMRASLRGNLSESARRTLAGLVGKEE